MNWKRWEHLNGRDRDWEDLTSCTLRKCFEKQPYRKNQNTKDGEIAIKNFDFDAYRLLVFTGFEQLKSKSNKTNNNNTNFNNIYLILSGSEETSLWIGYDGFQ